MDRDSEFSVSLSFLSYGNICFPYIIEKPMCYVRDMVNAQSMLTTFATQKGT